MLITQETLVENKRMDELIRVADKYIDYFKILNKEENITIISANELNAQEKDKVVKALTKGIPNSKFTVSYSVQNSFLNQVDSSILGGLQMYSGNKFMDCSLQSRISKVKMEISKISF